MANNDRIYTFRKSPEYSAAWTDQRSFAVPGWRIFGGLGTLHTNGNVKNHVIHLRKPE